VKRGEKKKGKDSEGFEKNKSGERVGQRQNIPTEEQLSASHVHTHRQIYK
jgi:hypothetical protein